MTKPRHLPKDRGLKALFAAYPQEALETLEALAPALIAQRGRPMTVEAVDPPLPLPALVAPGRLLPVALLCTWADGSREMVLLEKS